MTLLVKISAIEPVKKDLWLRAHLIITVERDSENPLITNVQTTLQNQQGLIIIKTFDSPESVAESVNNALMAKIPGEKSLIQ